MSAQHTPTTHEPHIALIAAAPDLLEALQACYEYLDMIPESATGGDDAAVALARRARAAIAKAQP